MKTEKEEPKHESLVKLNQIVSELRTITDIAEVKDVADKAKALQVYFRQTNESLDIQIRAAEAYLVSLRRMGELLIEMAETGQRRKRGGDTSKVEKITLLTLEKLGISKDLSFQSQRIANIPEKLFYDKIDEAKRVPKPPSKTSLLSLADKLEGKTKKKKKKEKPSPKEKELKQDVKPPFDEHPKEEPVPATEDPLIRLLTNVESKALNLCDDINEMISMYEGTDEEEFIKNVQSDEHLSENIYPTLSMLSDLLEEAFEILPYPNSL